MARRTTYSFEKRNKELRKKAKQDAKRERKRLAKLGLAPEGEDENLFEGVSESEAPAAPPGTQFAEESPGGADTSEASEA